MSIIRSFGLMHMRCDPCGYTDARPYAPKQFGQMVEDAKAKGWSVRKVAGEWENTCPGCLLKAPLQKPLL